jgi:hypothetical protein
MLVRVVAPHFVAGLIIETIVDTDGVERGVCTRAAPILSWCVWRDADYLSRYFTRKGWRASVVTST